MIDFINTTYGLWIMIYLAVGCIIMWSLDHKDANINTIAWIIGAVFWLPPTIIGFLYGMFGKKPN